MEYSPQPQFTHNLFGTAPALKAKNDNFLKEYIHADLAKVDRIRQNFQETWIWSMVDIELVCFIFKK